ncbi:hypothetical protein [Paenibacillus thalictri]|uniref:Uncharacterized protein n=1 Tax=Paenibacillus thalictri TaxID=2527873 RepID=A0A4Q9DIP0_9BACL|nr:hypothetical protein [Paenibacillus thalictri]TBL73069.1 hypothetical protein EYB31_27980 [Paenibacillus thalictri]
MFNQQQQQQSQQSGKGISSKELAYITDCLKNEELLAKMCLHGAAESQSPAWKQTFAQMAQERLQNSDQLLRALQMNSSFTH